MGTFSAFNGITNLEMRQPALSPGHSPGNKTSGTARAYENSLLVSFEVLSPTHVHTLPPPPLPTLTYHFHFRLLQKCSLVQTSKVLERDSQRQELSKLRLSQAELNSTLEAQRDEIHKLTQQINALEQQLSRVRRGSV